MSYILDALQRADAERERGHVPGLNSQIVSRAARKARPVRRWKPIRTAGAVVAALLIAAGLWWWFGQTSDAPAAPPAPATDAPPTAPPAAVVTEAPPAARLSPPAAPVQPILAPPREEPPKRPQASLPAAAPTAPATATPTPTPTPTPAPPAAAATTAPSASDANATPVRSFAELSPEARAQLPPVNVSGSTYSKSPALRMLIVNGKVVQEGHDIAPGLKLETIGQRSAVLNHNGLRYSIGY
jgi:general secretion pathway protein B